MYKKPFYCFSQQWLTPLYNLTFVPPNFMIIMPPATTDLFLTKWLIFSFQPVSSGTKWYPSISVTSRSFLGPVIKGFTSKKGKYSL